MNQMRVAGSTALGGLAATVAGCFAPWVEGAGLSRTGFDRGYPVVLVSVALAVIVVGTLTAPAVARITRWVALPFTIALGALALLELRSAFVARLVPADGASVPLDVSWGIWVVVAGSAVVAAASAATLRIRLPRPEPVESEVAA